jgi:hypothetical protein
MRSIQLRATLAETILLPRLFGVWRGHPERLREPALDCAP